MLYYLLLFSFISILIWIRVIAKFLNPGFHILHRSTYGNSTRTSVPLEKAFVEQKSSKGALEVEKGRVPSFSSHRVSVKTVTRSHYNCNSMFPVQETLKGSIGNTKKPKVTYALSH